MLRQIYSLGHFPNFAEKHEVFGHHAFTEASFSVSGRQTGSTGQLSRSRMGRNPDLGQGCPSQSLSLLFEVPRRFSLTAACISQELNIPLIGQLLGFV